MEHVNMLDLMAISAIVGALLPLLISFIKQSTWTSQLKKSVSLLLAVVSAVVATGVSQSWAIGSWADFWSYLLPSFGAIYALAQTTYMGFWEDTPIEARLAAAFDRAA
jgi:protein-S-isoprenylcysteine O-methyltransferase Ste14